MATPEELDNAVRYLKKLKLWLPKAQTFHRKTATNLNRLNRKVFARGGPAPIQPPPPPPFRP